VFAPVSFTSERREKFRRNSEKGIDSEWEDGPNERLSQMREEFFERYFV
jgi:hypothetical protein